MHDKNPCNPDSYKGQLKYLFNNFPSNSQLHNYLNINLL